jgi:putative transcriptional regulator
MITNRLRVLREHQLQTAPNPTIWTQEGFAATVGVSRQTIIAIEKGTYNPSLELAFKITAAFAMKIEDIFTYRGDQYER